MEEEENHITSPTDTETKEKEEINHKKREKEVLKVLPKWRTL